VDNGRADTVHKLYLDDGELNVPPTPLRGRQARLEWGRQLIEHRLGARFVTCAETCASVADGSKGTTVLTVFMVAGNEAAATVP
jgi:hypothetical protein